VLAKLAEVLVIEVLRLYANEQREDRTGWLAGVGDRVVGAALNALHAKPAHAWTLEELARAANSSRSVLAERFQQLVGSSPMAYLTQWRMLLAANLLARSNAPLARIAEDVGYQTDTAFSRAFRREFGAPPGGVAADPRATGRRGGDRFGLNVSLDADRARLTGTRRITRSRPSSRGGWRRPRRRPGWASAPP
jgi:AraC-like DNA-binding protein